MAKLVGAERGRDGVEVEDGAAGFVDKVGAGLHLGDLGALPDTPSTRGMIGGVADACGFEAHQRGRSPASSASRSTNAQPDIAGQQPEAAAQRLTLAVATPSLAALKRSFQNQPGDFADL